MRKYSTPQKSTGKERSDLPLGFLRAGGWGVGGGSLSELGLPGDGDPPSCRRHGVSLVIVDSESVLSVTTMSEDTSGRQGRPRRWVGVS